MPLRPLKKAEIVAALRRLGELAQSEGATIELALYGGAVFTIVFDARDSTKDVDAVARPAALARRLAARVAKENNLPETWLNDDVRQFVSEREAMRKLPRDDFGPGLIVSVPTAAYLLALKLQAFRSPLPGYEGDHGDIRFLLRKMELRTLKEVETAYQRFFPHDVLPADRRATLRAMLEETKP